MYDKYIDEFMPSKYMRDYLKTQELTPNQIAELIFKAPYSLNEKKHAFNNLINETDNQELKALCSRCIDEIEQAYYLLLNAGGVLNVYTSRTHGLITNVENSGLFSHFDDVLEFIADDKIDCDYSNSDYYGYIIKNWIKNDDGKLEYIIDYYIVNDEIYYFDYSCITRKSYNYDTVFFGFDLNLPVPFKTGDIIEFDGYPFYKKVYSIILSTGDNKDCCSLWNLYWKSNNTWATGAVKHGHVGYIEQFGLPIISPLYTARIHNEKLPKRFSILGNIKQELGSDEEKYKHLDSLVNSQGIREDDLLELINVAK